VRLGALARFVSEPVLIGFTAGAGVYIVVNQSREQGRKRGGRLLLCGVRSGTYGTFARAGLIPETTRIA
jgi:hypothetical protein